MSSIIASLRHDIAQLRCQLQQQSGTGHIDPDVLTRLQVICQQLNTAKQQQKQRQQQNTEQSPDIPSGEKEQADYTQLFRQYRVHCSSVSASVESKYRSLLVSSVSDALMLQEENQRLRTHIEMMMMQTTEEQQKQ